MNGEFLTSSSIEGVAKEATVGGVLRKILDCFFLLRIPLLVPVWTIFLLGIITGSSDAHAGGFFIGPYALSAIAWWGLLAFSLIVASIYVVNQIVDIESDRINHKLFLLPHGFISVRTAWTLAVVCAIGGIAISFFLLDSPTVTVLFFISLFLGYLYNLPPVQLKNSALGGVAANALGHGMLAFLVGWFIVHNGDPFSWATLHVGLISGLAPTLANAAVYLATTIPDAEGDRKTGKKTFCVAYGEKKTAIIAALFCAGTLIASFFMLYHPWVMAVPSGISLLVFILFAVSATRERSFKAFKWPVILLSIFVAIFFPEYALLILLTYFGSKIYYKWRFNFNYPTLNVK
jgi:4-hydroxybenzoate polyprenyltransferase